MKPSLRTKYLHLESDLNALFSSLTGYSSDLLQQKPAPGAWSVLEIMQHLMIVEEKSLGYVQKKTSYPDQLVHAGLSARFRNVFLKFFLRLPIRVKAPKVVNESNFDETATFETLVSKWRQQREELLDFLENAPEEWTRKLVYRHAIAGRLTMDGMLILFRDHFARHYQQILRTLQELESRNATPVA